MTIVVDIDRLRPILEEIGAAIPTDLEEMPGGSSPSFRIDLVDGTHLVLKTYTEGLSLVPSKEAFAAAQLRNLNIPATRYLLVDETRKRLPFRYAITSYLPGVLVRVLKDEPGIANVYRQMGELQRKLHTIPMPGYGSMSATGVASPAQTNADFLRPLIDGAFTGFVRFGGDAALAERLRAIIDERFDDIVLYNTGAVFAHDDLHPGNVLAARTAEGNLSLSGLIDFGNARATDPVFDLAKCLFCSRHEAPDSPMLILEGYGPIEHPDPEAALWYYTLLHRITMWWWLRHVGVIPTPDAPSDLIDDLRSMAYA
ncbi:phosphotransferase family protein [Devosia nitrariae]|uniref:Aminoglycoside phosphotransferase domain-containing protein n=1 Tax=Devosia nitrariae TaxID=2071872 RepID=A0ABQ5WC71_9HYPH|nr:aminoglycoside phosphotransferase family protein [Devosia nitrariae]GLQ57100.1 hypothetical protein GCM10010862_43590 [Devosia nitrariae]